MITRFFVYYFTMLGMRWLLASCNKQMVKFNETWPYMSWPISRYYFCRANQDSHAAQPKYTKYYSSRFFVQWNTKSPAIMC
jgi:hypothetical protein